MSIHMYVHAYTHAYIHTYEPGLITSIMCVQFIRKTNAFCTCVLIHK